MVRSELDRLRALVRKLVRVIPEAGQEFYHDHCPQQAAGIAYRVLFSIVPLAIFLVSIFGLILQNEALREDVVNAIVEHLPVTVAGRKDVEDALTSIATPFSAAGLVSLALFAYASTGMMSAIRFGLEAAMHVTRSRPTVRGKAVDLLLVVGAGVLVLLLAGLTLFGGYVQRTSAKIGDALGMGTGTLADLFLRLVSFAVLLGVVLLLYRFVPARGLRIRDGIAGALVTAILLELISLASGFVFDKATKFSVIYGSLTVGLVFLYSMYLYASALLFGAEVAAAWARPEPTEPGLPVLTQIKNGIVGLFVSQPDPEAQPRKQDSK
jgi:YihY family inner membrane protein